jgi:hypothetical protein
MAPPMHKYVGPMRRLATINAGVTPPQPRAFARRSTVRMSSSSATGSNNDGPGEVVTRQDLLDEAATLTKTLYRTCLRSVKVIRWGNSFDEKEFAKREEDFLKPSGPGGAISMSPRPDKDDELRSRAAYYLSYAREYFIQESDCLDNEPLREKDIKRYLYYLRKGDKDRKWLLSDMMFPDPYKTAMDLAHIERFEAMAKKYLGHDDEEDETKMEHPTKDDFFDDADDENPEWFQKLNK